MVNKRFVRYSENSKLLSNQQCGFHCNRSTLNLLVNINTNRSNNEQHLILIFLNLEKAYEMAWRNRILHKIKNWGINIYKLRITNL